jgi:hypothetical protein
MSISITQWKQQAPGLSGVFADNRFVDEALRILEKDSRVWSVVTGLRVGGGVGKEGNRRGNGKGRGRGLPESRMRPV